MKITLEAVVETLRNKRIQRGITIEKLSELSNVSVGTISTLETKKHTNMSVSTLFKLMNALNVSGYDIFGSEDEKINELIADNRQLRLALNGIVDQANGSLER
ncbi:helix-turn-helix domain-containing protein [Leuconostoc sp. MS02]|uniref:Helix-turn-helix domain-containing protein n=1 Tax=Leuconostoc aquikimchii TaxID=3236804 RepID=A0ABV3S4P0_9LACO